MHMVEKILNNTTVTPYGKIRASHEGSLHSSTLNEISTHFQDMTNPRSSIDLQQLRYALLIAAEFSAEMSKWNDRFRDVCELLPTYLKQRRL